MGKFRNYVFAVAGKRIIETTVVLIVLVIFVSSAEAIKINTAKVQNGVTVVKGNQADGNATITWEGADVTQTNNGGSFQFSGVVPSDCVGTLSDGVETIEVAVSGCEVSGLLATGQTMAFQANKNDGDGGILDNVDDDGTLQIGVPLQYVDNGDGTVTDLNTGLMWEKKDDSGGLHDKDNQFRWSGDGTQETIWDWLDDVNAEGGTEFAGYDDWRIPNIRELHSIVDYGRANPSIDPIFGPVVSDYLSSTTLASEPTNAWVVGFANGRVVDGNKAGFNFVRAVRGGL